MDHRDTNEANANAAHTAKTPSCTQTPTSHTILFLNCLCCNARSFLCNSSLTSALASVGARPDDAHPFPDPDDPEGVGRRGVRGMTMLMGRLKVWTLMWRMHGRR